MKYFKNHSLIIIIIIAFIACERKDEFYDKKVHVLKNYHTSSHIRRDSFNSHLFYSRNRNGLLIKFLDVQNEVPTEVFFQISNNLLEKTSKKLKFFDSISLKHITIYEINSNTNVQDDNTYLYFKKVNKKWYLVYAINTDWSNSHSFFSKYNERKLIDSIISYRKQIVKIPIPPK